MSQTDTLLEFIKHCPTSFHAIKEIKQVLSNLGYQELKEQEEWDLLPQGSYYVIRNDSSLISFHLPSRLTGGFMIGAAHSDSPSFKLKPNPELIQDGMVRLNVEPYGGMLVSTWFDRPLTIGGRICYFDQGAVKRSLVYIDQDLLVIPSLAIHMDRTVNEGHKFDLQKELLPLFRTADSATSFLTLLASETGCSEEDILSYDLFLCQRTPGTVFGANQEFIGAGRLDDLQCAYSLWNGFIQARESESIPVLAIFDHEEVGSMSMQGADGTFLSDVLGRIARSVNMETEVLAARSFLISADNAHAVHPNYPEKADSSSRPKLNGGIVIKSAASQAYTSDAISSALFRSLCNEAGLKVQEFVNHSNIRGGSTLGRLSLSHFSLHSVDIGLPQLAMHSSWETAGASDTDTLIQAMKRFYSSDLLEEDGAMRFRY
ncbi:MAG: M18 family aminopeptidase [Solobacterium sp.]|nr:M18 family aminopeptidase [Solobacterium sp.]